MLHGASVRAQRPHLTVRGGEKQPWAAQGGLPCRDNCMPLGTNLASLSLDYLICKVRGLDQTTANILWIYFQKG